MTERDVILPLFSVSIPFCNVLRWKVVPKAKEVSHFLLAGIVGNVFDLWKI